VLERLAEAVAPEREPLILEIGPGRGALTEFLAARAERVVAIELDRALSAQLAAKLPSVEVVHADILQTDLAHWGPVAVAGNLPYYITSPILSRIFRLGALLKRAVVLVQLEVAERLVARPGTRNYGLLTVETQLFTEPEILFRVPASAFSPPPKVESAAVRLVPRPFPPAAAGFLEFTARAFRHKRKTLRNNLLPYCGRQVEAWPEARLRAEQIPLEQLLEIYARLGPATATPPGPRPGSTDSGPTGSSQ
jgi:16S rRNA (adenine1518-N6/adenine1519-N6)-dimethyltransferase